APEEPRQPRQPRQPRVPALPLVGVIVMGTKSIAAFVAAAVIALAALMLSDGPDTMRLGAPLATDVPVATAEASVDVVLAPPASVSARAAESVAPVESIEAPAPEAGPSVASDAAPRVVLRATVVGTRPTSAGLELLVRCGVPARKLCAVPVSGDGPVEVELNEALEEVLGSVDVAQRFHVALLGEGHLESYGWAAHVDEGRKGEHTLRIALVGRPIARTLRGRLVSEDGAPIGRGNMVEFVPVGALRDDPTFVLANERAARDGAFELPLATEEPGELIAVAEGYCARHVAVRADQLGDVDVGELTLTRGARISGRVLAPGQAVAFTRRAAVIASAPYAPAAWNERALGFQVRDGRLHNELVSAQVEADGSFELFGLEPGWTYNLVFVPDKVDGVRVSLLALSSFGRAVTAPASNVALEQSLAVVHVVVEGVSLERSGPVTGAELRAVLDDEDGLGAVPEGLRRDSVVRLGHGGEAYVLVPPDRTTTLRASAPSFASVVARLDPTRLPIERGALRGPFVISLGDSEAPATLEWRVAYDGPGKLDGAQLYAVLYSGTGAPKQLGPAPIIAGVATFRPAPTGSWLGRPWVHIPQSTALADLPYDLALFANVELELRSGEATVVSSRLAVGGRIEVGLVGRDPLLDPPSFQLVEEGGNVVFPTLFTVDPRGHDSARAITTDGPYCLERALPAGTYVVRQVGLAYKEQSLEALVRRGETTRLTVSLVPR
ncbi:MAG: hypothetical protein R3F49_10050, partial [Planctomycetota bacterium]